MYARIFLAAAAFLSLRGYAATVPPQNQKVAVLELFTSEGCSSCPQADVLLQQVHGRTTQDGQLVIGISEHVTYWNSLGWKDPYSAETFTARQEKYAARLADGQPYTPQAVLNGRVQLLGSDSRALQDALHREVAKKSVEVTISSANVQPQTIDLKFAVQGLVQGSEKAKPVEIVAVITDDTDRSSVLRGENSGRSLTHVSVARLMTTVATVRNDGEQSVRLALPSSLHLAHGAQHLVLLAQVPHQEEILGATSVALDVK
ncbi:DUF1223 domain-containing protein [Terriglobus albidus]|nr:DUF1223 domain-containing protein [Terriglobus albidus]